MDVETMQQYILINAGITNTGGTAPLIPLIHNRWAGSNGGGGTSERRSAAPSDGEYIYRSAFPWIDRRVGCSVLIRVFQETNTHRKLRNTRCIQIGRGNTHKHKQAPPAHTDTHTRLHTVSRGVI